MKKKDYKKCTWKDCDKCKEIPCIKHSFKGLKNKKTKGKIEMFKSIFNVMLYKDKELTEEAEWLNPNNKVDIIEMGQNYVKIHIINDYYISLEQFIGGFEKV